MDAPDYVGALIRLNGGEIVGKTRLQKITYLLEAKGLGSGLLDFDYHNYGPFSAELAFAADDAESLGYIKTEDRPGFHEVPYTVFTSKDKAPTFEEDSDTDARRDALQQMSDYSALVLELAATAVYLKKNGYPDRHWDEVKRRKPLKATPERLEQAKRLVAKLGL